MSEAIHDIDDETLKRWLNKARRVQRMLRDDDPVAPDYEDLVVSLETEIGRRQGLVA